MQSKEQKVHVIGGGLAGSEAAWQLIRRNISVVLSEMRPTTMTKAHKTGRFAELVCSNSFRGAALTNAVGLLKEELRQLNSLILEAADVAKVPAGGALAVDREQFSQFIDERLRSHPLVEIREEEVISIDLDQPTIVATGPLTSPRLADALRALTGSEQLSFFDAISPIIFRESLDETQMFRQSRYDKGGGADYLNIPLSEQQYYRFVEEVQAAEKYGAHEEVESDLIGHLRPFEGCMPIEEMIARGPDTLRFGPYKPTGLRDPKTGRRPFAVVQLRQDDQGGNLWSMVGMQTRMKHGEQLRIFRSLPGLQNAEFVRLGTVHRNSFINSPVCLSTTLQLRKYPKTFVAGQLTGVEGYVESTAGGLVAGINAARIMRGLTAVEFPISTAIGALMNYISDPTRVEFQPMNISFGLMPSYFELNANTRQPKEERRLQTSEHALKDLSAFQKQIA